MHDLLRLADELGLVVVEKRVAHASGYLPGDHTIALTPRMPRRTGRSVLAHEIAHHVLEHRPTEFGPIRKRQEREANEWAACHLISHEAYSEVERLRDGHIEAMAHDLDVATELAIVFRSMLARIGDTVYVDPRMGAGQFAHRTEVA